MPHELQFGQENRTKKRRQAAGSVRSISDSVRNNLMEQKEIIRSKRKATKTSPNNSNKNVVVVEFDVITRFCFDFWIHVESHARLPKGKKWANDRQ